MKENYYKDLEAHMIRKFLGELSIMCGDSVVLKGIERYLVSRNKSISNLSSSDSITINLKFYE